MDSITYVFVDVFAARPLEGNPLALVPDADDLTVGQMQAIAREFNQSETTFLLRPTEDGVDRHLRSFTPAGVEVDGAGHNALGAWLWLAEHEYLGTEPVARFRQRIGPEVLAVEIHREQDGTTRVVMDQGTPVLGATVDHIETLADALGLRAEDVDPAHAAQTASTGVAHLMVPLRDAGTVDRAVSHDRALAAVLAGAGAEGCYLYTTAVPADSPPGTTAYTRFFNPTVGIAEDPATGTAAGPLAVALTRSGRAPADGRVLIEQGHALGRPSLIRVDVDGDSVRLSGAGVVSGQGTLRLV